MSLITIEAAINNKSVTITYDPSDPEAVKAAETWRKALFAVKDEGNVKFGEQQCRDYLKGAVERYLQNKQKHVDQAAADSEKVAETVKSGRWEKSDIPCEEYVCSECGGACWYYGYNGKLGKSRYCPNCGARMEDVT